MTNTHLLSDTVSRIKNALLVKKKVIILLYSKLIESFLDILVNEGYILGKKKYNERIGIAKIKVYLKYVNNCFPSINDLKIVSKPGSRVYSKCKFLSNTYNGLGTTILSTSRGIITYRYAREINCGGEVLCKVF